VGLVVGALFVLVVLVIAFTGSDENNTALSTLNPGPYGTRALAEVARDQGADVREVDRLGSARITDPATTTLVVADGSYLQTFQARSILDYPGDVVVFGGASAFFSALELELSDTWSEPGTFPANCADPDAVAAGTVASVGMTISGELPADAEGCFPAASGEWVLVTLDRDGRRLVVVSDSEIPTNASVAKEGNAALALRAIGKHPHIVWYVGSAWDGSTLTWTVPVDPEPGEPGGGSGSGSGGSPASPEAAPDFLPPGTGTFLYGLAVALIVVVLWRARRFGALVVEPLPVVIRSSEATKGRARLYRAARSYGRAGTALRAGAATRLAKRLGVSRYDSQEALIAAISRATSKRGEEVADVLFGAPPQSESDMMDLALALDELEREVHRQ
jgi:hypothetical protein